MEPQPISQFQSRLVGSWADQQDEEENSPRRVEATTQSKTPNIGRVRAKWVEILVKGDQKRVKSSNITSSHRKQHQKYIGYMALMTEVMDSQNMVGKNRSSDQVPQRKVEKSSSLKAATIAAKNVVVLETNPGG